MARKRNKQLSDLIDKSLLSYMKPQSSIASQFRSIRNNIEYAAEGKKIRSLIITSPSCQEGKTTATVNLAVSKVQRGDKVLIIDANMKNPTIHDIFSLKMSPGLTNVLVGESILKEAIFPTEIMNLDILPFGTPLQNAVEVMNSNDMNDLLELATRQYDCVIIDTAAVIDVLETNTLASKCDGVILVLQRGKSQRELAQKAKRSLEFFAKAKIIGVILNNKVAK